MAKYGDLEAGNYYLIQENENGALDLIFVPMASEQAILVEYEDAEKTRLWFRKGDTFHELVEKFSEENAAAYEQIAAAANSDIPFPDWAESDAPKHTEEFWNEDEDDLELPYKN